MIDPKPFVGDAGYDVTQHLFNCETRLRANPRELIRRVAGLCELDPARVQHWMFARAAAGSREVWRADSLDLARRLSIGL